MKKVLCIIFVVSMIPFSMSCSKDDDIEEEDNNSLVINVEPDSIASNENEADSLNDGRGWNEIVVSLFAQNAQSHQSAAAFGDYAFFITDRRSTLYFYNLNKKKLICVKNLGAVNERTTGNYILYHCNQMTFGVDFFEKDDPFPLLYISQRARSDRRCITEVYRLIPTLSNSGDYVDLNAELVQTIFFPVETMDNSLGRVNSVIDGSNGLLYTYSYSTISSDPNRGLCRISSFQIPDIREKEVFLNDNSIINSYKLDYIAINSQGAAIKDDVLYILQGYESYGIHLNVIDLKEKQIISRVDLLAQGITWEPEGCFMYNNHLMVSSGKRIWEFVFY